AANVLFRDARAARPPQLDREVVLEWISALAEVAPELEHELGRRKLEDVNVFAVLDFKIRWLNALADAGVGEHVENLDERGAVRLMGPAVHEAALNHDLRKVIAWLGVSHFSRVAPEPLELSRELARPHRIPEGPKARLLDFGRQAANLFAAQSLV